MPARTPATRPLWLPILAALLLTAWSLVVPIFEGPDEPAHWQFARYLHDTGSLPRYVPGFEEANSPPLAYLLFAPVARDAGSPSMVVLPGVEGNWISTAPPRRFLNTSRDFERYWPIRLARLLAVLASTGTVYLSYRAGVTAGGTATGLLTALIVLLLPQFTFRGSQVSNDALVTLFSAAVTLGVVQLARRGFAWGRAAATAAALAAAYLSKISAIALVVPLTLALIAAAPRVPWRARAVRLSVLALPLALVLPWTIRNIVLYGDPFASAAMRVAVAHIITDRPLLSAYFVTDFPKLLAASFVGLFGWANVLLPLWAYGLYGALFVAAAAGLGRGLRRGTIDRRLALLLGVTGGAALAVVVHINLSFTQPQGRYLFPALPAFALLVALGIGALPGRLTQLATPLRYGLLFGALNVYALAAVVWPAYWPAPDRWISARERLLQPAAVLDAVAAGPDTFVVTGPHPSWVTPVDEEAADVGALVLDLQGTASRPHQRGCVSFATRERELREHAPLCFSWIADGALRRVTVPLADHPGWSGFVTHLGVAPFDADPMPGWRYVHRRAVLVRRPAAD